MKLKCIISAFLLLQGFFAVAQNAPGEWQPLMAFHHIMSTTYHPAEEGNFVPIRQKVDSMVMIAKSWKKSPIPAEFKVAETRKTLELLFKQTKALQKAVNRKKDDATLMALLTKAHDSFHHIVGECRDNS